MRNQANMPAIITRLLFSIYQTLTFLPPSWAPQVNFGNTSAPCFELHQALCIALKPINRDTLMRWSRDIFISTFRSLLETVNPFFVLRVSWLCSNPIPDQLQGFRFYPRALLEHASLLDRSEPSSACLPPSPGMASVYDPFSKISPILQVFVHGLYRIWRRTIGHTLASDSRTSSELI